MQTLAASDTLTVLDIAMLLYCVTHYFSIFMQAMGIFKIAISVILLGLHIIVRSLTIHLVGLGWLLFCSFHLFHLFILRGVRWFFGGGVTVGIIRHCLSSGVASNWFRIRFLAINLMNSIIVICLWRDQNPKWW